MVNGGEPELVGGHRRRPRRRGRCGAAGTPSCGSSPVAAASTSASVSGRRASHDCTGLRAATAHRRAARSSRAIAAVHQVLPTSVPVPATNTSVRAGRASRASGNSVGERGGERGRPARRCARPTARPAGATCPAAPSAAGWRGRAGPASSSAGRGRERARFAPAARPARSATGDRARTRSTWARSRVAQLVALGRADARASAASAAAASAGRRRGGEDVGAGAVHEQVGEAARARRRTRRARRASSTACRRAARRRRRASRRELGAEHRVRLVEHEQRAVARAHLERARRPARRRRPSRTRCR